MLNDSQYSILLLVSQQDEFNPFSAIDVINHFRTNQNISPLITDEYISFLCNCGYLEIRDPAKPNYRTGYGGPLYITAAGLLAINDYEFHMQQIASNERSLKTQTIRFIISTVLGVLTLLAAVIMPLVV